MYKYFYFHRFKNPSQDYKPVILVTGCSSGIGLALAKLLCERTEYRVIITAREKSLGVLRQNFFESDRFWILPLDVSSEDKRLKGQSSYSPSDVLDSDSFFAKKARINTQAFIYSDF